jgi:hypothetical protein
MSESDLPKAPTADEALAKKLAPSGAEVYASWLEHM